MPVNTAALKTFAPAMRRQLLEAVRRKLDLLLNSQTPDTLTTYAKQIAELREQEAESREQLLERVAYTWFNRLVALRYLDARGWHPFGARVLMPQTESETQPELLKLLRSGSLPAELQTHTDEARLQGLLDGRLPTAHAGADPHEEVYRELILVVCRSYHQLLPTLFEGLDDASELLLPDDLLSDGSIAGGFRSQISDDDCEDVEIIGWLYQFYISEKKDQVIGKVVKSEDIPAATQLFTPNWIVKYMVQNSLGAQWLATYPASALKGQMEYYIRPAEQTDDVKAQLAAITPESLDPEDLTLIDPACGSGHILVEAYELFKAIYLERGYQQREIPQLILEKNLYGLDIDERAAQLTSFALIMKGRCDDRRLFERGIQLNVMALVNSDGLDVEGLANAINLAVRGLKLADLVELKKLFEHATTFGSLIQVPNGLALKLPALRRLSEVKGQDMVVAETLKTLEPLVRQAELLAAQYNTAIANPPYMGIGGMNGLVKRLIGDTFPNAKSDLFACFIERNYAYAKSNGCISMVTMQNWMFISSFEKMRKYMLCNKTILSMVQIGYNSFPAMNSKVAQAVAFCIVNAPINGLKGAFSNLNNAPQSSDKKALFLARKPEHQFFASANEFTKIPGSPIAYWISESIGSSFTDFPPVSTICVTKKGISSGNNDQSLRAWSEVCFGEIGIGQTSNSGFRYFPHCKGGKYRKWFGNLETVLKYSELDISRMERYPGFRHDGRDYFFREGVTWSDVTSGKPSGRLMPSGCTFDNSGPTAFFDNSHGLLYGIALLNTKFLYLVADILNPTLHFLPGNFDNLPFAQSIPFHSLDRIVGKLIDLSRADWVSYERSWDFQSPSLLSSATVPNLTLEESYAAWFSSNNETIAEMKRLEEENNSLFIDAFGLQDELTSDVPVDQITLTSNPAYRYGGNLADKELRIRFQSDTMQELISYSVGCMMGRYSLDAPGLIYANSGNQGFDPSRYTFFPADSDGIIPILDEEWFEDDIVARSREFLAVTFPESSVTDNLRFIEESLGKDIRKYFCTEFYKDHLQTYKKRPIYWLVQSPKKGFACLIYLHRYTKDTLNQVLNNYFRPYLQKLEARLAQLGLDQLNDDLPARERTVARKDADKIAKVLKECQAWEQDALLPLAQQRIELDLDDGVKVNYLKLQDVLAPIPGLAAKED